MSKTESRRPALQNDLYIRSEELPGTPAPDAGGADGSDGNADNLVRQLLIEEKRRTMPDQLPEIAPQEDVEVFEADLQRESPRESIAQILKAERAAEKEDAERKQSWLRLPRIGLPRLRMPRVGLPSLRRSREQVEAAVDHESDAQPVTRRALPIPDWVRNYRPTKKHVFWAVVAALVLYRPLMLPLIALVLFWVVLIAYLTIGPDRWAEILGSAWQKLQHRRPALADRVRTRADAFAEKFDRFLDYLPESWAERLALPDFSTNLDEDDDRPDPFDRLAADARQV